MKSKEKVMAINEEFQNSIEKYPDKVAIVYEKEKLTYKELDLISSSRTNYLLNHGVKHGDRIGVLIEDSLEFVISIISLIKIGACYIPISKKENSEYINNLVIEANISKVLSISSMDYPCLIYPRFNEVMAIEKNQPNIGIRDTNIAYIMFTSGTTGEPKGVQISHSNIINLVKNDVYLKLTENNIFLQTGAFSFDATTFEIWGALLNGGTVVLTDLSSVTNFDYLSELIIRNKVNTMWLTSPLFSIAVEKKISLFDCIMHLIIGGDIVRPEDTNKTLKRNPSLSIYNGYGPTECTTFTTLYKIEFDPLEKPIPIGKPLKNVSVYIFDENLKELKSGVIGELYIGGAGVSPGYIKETISEDSKFISNPFADGKLYRSGDLAKMDTNGVIHFVGRKDRQFKIRGFRVELSAVENVLSKINGVQSVAVTISIDSTGRKNLVACIKLNEGFQLTEDEIRNEFKILAPSHIVLSVIKIVPSIPMNRNGKIDYKKILDLTNENVKSEIDAETLSPERTVQQIIQKNMDTKIDDTSISFFDIGLDSLTSIYVADEINKTFQINIEPTDMILSPTIDSFIQLVLTKKTSERYVTKSDSYENGYFELLNQQTPLYVDYSINPNSTRYNVPLLFELPNNIDINKLMEAIENTINRHDGLKTKFNIEGGKLQQQIDQYCSPNIMFANTIPNLEELITPFDLENGPLYKVVILTKGSNRWLFMDFHHIVVDGFSLKVILEDIEAVYLSNTLPPLKYSYRDIVISSRKYFEENQSNSEEFWKMIFSNYSGMSSLPYDSSSNESSIKNNKKIDFTISQNLYLSLKEWCKLNNFTVFEGLVICYKDFLHEITGSESISFATPTREFSQLSNVPTVSMLTNTLWIMSNKPSKNSLVIEDFIYKLRKAQGNQSIESEQIYNLKRSKNDNNIDETLIAYHDYESIKKSFLGQKILSKPIVPTEGMFSLNMQIYDLGDSLNVEWEYLSDLFEFETMQTLVEIFSNILKELR
ncbi:amino acid adenylation domain-containing protein [Enterococcus plantarum]|uniref:non-ribosomal peptide synthetase n=1 Tax=Enterococcus plantarum TaxID=1077675 RepID=UPI001A8F33B7|nr:non-ribosomal peptide synthetase [Enterococcus plantarum]MBO0468539.1 amino acid adenylation domain-containing protein [Enterococcus plantarum]